MIFYNGQGEQINISSDIANVGAVVTTENNAMNPWANPLELWLPR